MASPLPCAHSAGTLASVLLLGPQLPLPLSTGRDLHLLASPPPCHQVQLKVTTWRLDLQLPCSPPVAPDPAPAFVTWCAASSPDCCSRRAPLECDPLGHQLCPAPGTANAQEMAVASRSGGRESLGHPWPLDTVTAPAQAQRPPRPPSQQLCGRGRSPGRALRGPGAGGSDACLQRELAGWGCHAESGSATVGLVTCQTHFLSARPSPPPPLVPHAALCPTSPGGRGRWASLLQGHGWLGAGLSGSGPAAATPSWWCRCRWCRCW